MIRTKIVDLTSLDAVAYRRKLGSGGASLVIVRRDGVAPGLAQISSNTGAAQPSANTNTDLYPSAAFVEAIELTAGLPFGKRGPVRVGDVAGTTGPNQAGETVAASVASTAAEPGTPSAPVNQSADAGTSGSATVPTSDASNASDDPTLTAAIDGSDYRLILDAYTDKRGRLSYDILNRDFIQTLRSSGQTKLMLQNGAPLEEIRFQTIKDRFRTVTRNPALTDAQVLLLIEILDDVSPKNVFRPLEDEIKKMLAEK